MKVVFGRELWMAAQLGAIRGKPASKDTARANVRKAASATVSIGASHDGPFRAARCGPYLSPRLRSSKARPGRHMEDGREKTAADTESSGRRWGC